MFSRTVHFGQSMKFKISTCIGTLPLLVAPSLHFLVADIFAPICFVLLKTTMVYLRAALPCRLSWMIRSYLIRDHLVMALILLHILVQIIFSLSSEKDPEASTVSVLLFCVILPSLWVT